MSAVPVVRQPVVVTVAVALVTGIRITATEMLIIVIKPRPTVGNVSLVLIVRSAVPVVPAVIIVPVVVTAVVVVIVATTVVVRVEAPVSIIISWWSTISTHLLWWHSTHIVVPEPSVAIL